MVVYEKENMMLNLLVTIFVLIIIFAIVYYVIGMIPFPAHLANVKWILYVILAIIIIVVLLQLIPGINLKL